MSAASRVPALLAACMLLGGCFLFGGGGPEPVEDPEVVRFAERIDTFYRSFEGVPVDLRSTFEDPSRREFFASEDDFASYYASLAADARRSLLRNSTADEVVIDGFRFESDDVALVDVRYIGKHVRRLRWATWRSSAPTPGAVSAAAGC